LDLRYEHVPIWHAVQQAVRSGESPFWIDGQYCGNPLLFSQEAPPFYPLTVPLLATGAPAHRLADLFSLFHFWLAGFAAFLLLRDLRCGFSSALFGGIAWMLSARMVQSAIWPNAVAVAALLPLLLLGTLRIALGRRRSGVIIAAISGGLSLLAARPHVIVGAAPLVIVAAVTALALSPRKVRALVDLALAVVLALLLGAPSVVPAAALLPETSRAGGLERAGRDLSSLAPGADLDQVFLPVDGPTRWPEAAAYPGVLVGLLTIAGAVLALRRQSVFPRILFAGLFAGGVIGLVFAFGESGPLGLVADLPLLRGFRVPARYLTSWSLALALSSALALSEILRRSSRPSLVAVFCVSALALDLTLHAWNAAPTAPASVYTVEPESVGAVRPQPATDEAGFPGRVWSVVPPPFPWLFDDPEKLSLARRSEPLYGAIGMIFGLEMVGGAGPSLARWKALFLGVDARKAALAGAGALVLPASVPAARTGAPEFFVMRFRPLPRAVVVSEALVVEPSRALEAVLDERLDPRRTAVLESGAAFGAGSPERPEAGAARLVERGPGRLKLKVRSSGAAVLVVFNTFERGWRASVDGKPQPILVADAAFQGVRLAPGEHVVELEYHPRGLAAGIAAAALGFLGVVMCALRMSPS
jgi:hypothetical protein